MFERFTADARRAVVLAQEEARMLNHNYIGTEHLLLSLTKDGGHAGTALAGTGVTHSEALGHIEELIGRGHTPQTGHIPFVPEARTVLETGVRIALQIGHNHVGAEHLLLALLRNPASVGCLTLHRCGVARATVAKAVAGLLGPASIHPEVRDGYITVLNGTATPGAGADKGTPFVLAG